MQTPPYSALFDQWQNYQKSYLDAWQAMAESSAPGKSLGSPWNDLLEKWWKTFSTQSAPGSRDLFSMLVEQGKNFFNVASTLNGSLAEAMKIQTSGGEWEKVISKSFDGLRDSLAAGTSSIPMELWHKFVIDRFQSNGDWMPDFIKQFQDASKQILSMPALGQSREKQEQLQKLATEISQFQTSCAKFSEVQTKIHNLSVDLLQKKVIQKFNNQDYPESYRAIYDLWVDCYEEVYAEAVMQPEYNEAYSQMVNCLMSVTLTYRELQDDLLETCGLPSRKELDTLYRRFHDERRQAKIMRADIQSLKEQINQLVQSARTPAAAPEADFETPSEPASKPAPRRRSSRRATAAESKSTSKLST
ncbi:MAG: poly(R)-hydroxyalkanoic acid synthase subunit PhaE [Methylococcales bacterium]